MENTVQKIPFLRITVALAAGIIIASNFQISTPVCFAGLLITTGILFAIHKYYNFKFNSLFGILIHLEFILLGIFNYNHFNKTPCLPDKKEFIATVLEKPLEKPNSYKTLIRVSGFRSADSIFPANEKVIAYFEKNGQVSAIKPGDVIYGKQAFQPIKNNGNPYDFDVQKYWSRKKIFRQIYISEKKWFFTGKRNEPIIVKAEILREKLLKIYRDNPVGEREFEILSALTLGYKRELDPETRRIFSSTGATHVLAVSGLHVGIVFWLITLLLGFLKKHKSGRILFLAIAVFILWGYALLTGLSPSVLRASAMFTIYIVGENLKRPSTIYNSLSASAFLLLLLNPNNLFDLGFQLSYSAVFGIVFLQPKLGKLFIVKNKILSFFWSLLTVSISAQIATIPLTVYFFNQFPTYFWLTNSFIIPVVMVLIPAGFGLLLFNSIAPLASVLSVSISFILKNTCQALLFIESLPLSMLYFSMNLIQLFFLVFTMISFFLFIKSRRVFHLKLSLGFTLMFITGILVNQLVCFRQKEIIVYSNPENTVIHFIGGKYNCIVSEKEIKETDFIYTTVRQTCLKRGLRTPFFYTSKDTVYSPNIILKNGLIYFENKWVIFGRSAIKPPEVVQPDFLINTENARQAGHHSIKKHKIIMNKRFYSITDKIIPDIHFTNLNGAFSEKW